MLTSKDSKLCSEDSSVCVESCLSSNVIGVVLEVAVLWRESSCRKGRGEDWIRGPESGDFPANGPDISLAFCALFCWDEAKNMDEGSR